MSRLIVRNITFIILALILGASILMIQSEGFELVQNKPAPIGELVTFTIEMDTTLEKIPLIAWDFGDGSGLGRYKRSLTATNRFSNPGVYQVFARIQGENIPLFTTQTVFNPPTALAPTRSSTICIDTARNLVWVVNADNNSISAIDINTNTLIKEIPVGKHPRTLAIDANGNVWVSNEDDGTVSIVSTEGVLLNTIHLPYASRPYGVCFDPLKNYCYVTLQSTGELVKINAKTQSIDARVEVGKTPRGIAITSTGKEVYVSQFVSPEDHGLVRLVQASDMSLVMEIILSFDHTPDFEDRGRGVPNYISSLTISPDGKQLWVPSKKDNTARGLFRDGEELTFDNTVRTQVTRIDLETKEELINLKADINDADLSNAVEISPYGNIAFISLQGNNKITMIDVSTNARLGQLDSTGLAPQGLVLNANGTRLYVHNFMSRTVKVFNTENIILSNNFVSVAETTIPTVTTDLLSPEVLLGKQVFYNAEDSRMTFAGYISCATCHMDGGSDERVWDFTDRGEGFRNTHSLNGRAGTAMGNVHWTANFDEIQDFENDMRNSFGGSGFLTNEQFNSGTTSDPLGDKKAGLNPELDALAAYVTSLSEVHPSPYRNQDGSMTLEGQLGKEVFVKAGCNSCHSGGTFTDKTSGVFHDVGTILTSSGQRRNGNLTGFSTPTLKGIWETAPYLHDGSAATLHDVLVTKNSQDKHGQVSSLKESEIDQLIAFLLQIDESDDGLIAGMKASNNYLDNLTLTVSPNPATELITVCFPFNENIKGTLKITTVENRRIVKEIELVDTEEIAIEVSHLKPGLYLIQYSNDKKKLTSKLIIQ